MPIQRARSTASVGPIGVVQAQAAQAQARGWDSAAQGFSGITSSILAGISADYDKEKRAGLNDALSRGQVAMDAYFWEVYGTEGAAEKYDTYANNHASAIVAGVDPNIQDAVREGFDTLISTRTFAMRSKAASDAEAAQVTANNYTTDMAVLEVQTKLTEFTAANPEDEAAVTAFVQATMPTYLEGLPENKRGEAEVAMSRSALAASSRTAAAALERLNLNAQSNLSLAVDTAAQDISSLIASGVPFADVQNQLEALRGTMLSRVGDGGYATADAAMTQWRVIANNASAQALAREMGGMIAAGDKAGADALATAYMAGQQTGVPNYSGAPAGSETNAIVGTAFGMVSKVVDPTASTGLTVTQHIEIDDLQERIADNPRSVTPLEIEGSPAAAGILATMARDYVNNNYLLDQAEFAGDRNIPKEQSLVALLELNRMSTTDREKALELLQTEMGWDVANYIADPAVLDQAVGWMTRTQTPLDSVETYFNSASGIDANGDTLLADANAYVHAFDVVNRGVPGMAEAIVGRNYDLLSTVFEESGGGKSPELVASVLKRELNKTPLPAAAQTKIDELALLVESELSGGTEVSSRMEMRAMDVVMGNTLLQSWTRDVLNGVSSNMEIRDQFGTVQIIPPMTGYGSQIPTSLTRQAVPTQGTIDMLQRAANWFVTEISGVGFLSETPSLPAFNTPAGRLWWAATKEEIIASNGTMSIDTALVRGLQKVDEAGYSLSMFDAANNSVPDQQGGLAITYRAPEASLSAAGYDLQSALFQIVLTGTEDAQAYGPPNIDIQGAIDDGRVIMIPASDWTAADPAYQIQIMPPEGSGVQESAFILFGGNSWHYDPAVNMRFTDDGIEVARALGLDDVWWAGAVASFAAAGERRLLELQQNPALRALTSHVKDGDTGPSMIDQFTPGFTPRLETP